MSGSGINSVFYAETYHPIQAGSIDGTDTVPHDNAVYRALLCSSAGLYDPSGDPKAIGDPYCTIFVGRLNRLTTEETLREAMSKYGHVKNLRLVRDIVTGASRGYSFVEFETEREMHRAYEDAHHSLIDDSEIIVDYNRQRLMPGWIPRRLGGGLGGKKESGQLRFGGRERPFRAPLKPVPYDDLKKLGIPPPPEGRYMSRFQVPSLPRRKQSSVEEEEGFDKRSLVNKEVHHRRSSSEEIDEHYNKRSAVDKEERSSKRCSPEREDHHRRRIPVSREKVHDKRTPVGTEEPSSAGIEEYSRDRSSRDREEVSHRHHKHGSRSSRHRRRRSPSQGYSDH